MNITNEQKLIDRHKMMLAYQEKIKPFTPTYRELQKVWKLHTTSAVSLALRNTEERKLVISRSRKTDTDRESRQFYAIPNS